MLDAPLPATAKLDLAEQLGRRLAAERGRVPDLRPAFRSLQVPATQARAEFVFTGLRRLAGVDAVAFERRFGTPLHAAFPQLTRLADDGLVEEAAGRVRPTARGLVFADSVGAEIV